MLPIVVLSGGLATRLRPTTEKIPKSLIEVNQKPFVIHQLELFRSAGIERIHYCLGYLGEMVEAVVTETDFFNQMTITFSYDGEKLLGTGGAIKKAFPYLSDVFFVTYGDSYLEVSYNEIEDFYSSKKTKSEALMVIYHNKSLYDKSNVRFEKANLYYSKKNPVENMYYIDYGISILNKSHFNAFPVGEGFDLSEVLERLSLQNKLMGYEVFNRFYEIGSFKGIEDLSNHLKHTL